MHVQKWKVSLLQARWQPKDVFTVEIGKQPLIFQKVTYLVTRRIDQIDPKTWLIFGVLTKFNDG